VEEEEEEEEEDYAAITPIISLHVLSSSSSSGMPLPSYDAVVSFKKPSQELLQVNNKYKQWLSQGADNYQYEVTRGGFLPALWREPALVTVSKDKVVNGG